MAEKTTQRPKIYLIVVLLIVLSLVLYFRFVHKKRKHVAAQARSEVNFAPLDVPRIQLPQLLHAQQPEPFANASNRAIARDIFRPLKAHPGQGKIRLHEDDPLKTAASLKLKGTIVGRGKPIAIINNRFVRTGDWIGGLRVVKIGKKGVLLDSGSEKIDLEMVKND